MAIKYIEQDRTFWLDTEHTSYLLAIVDQENFVGHVYYGQKLQYTENTPAPVYLLRTGEAPFVPSQNNRERVSFLDSFPVEYPGNGLGDYRESAISVRTAQGHVGVQLQYVSHEIVKEKPALPGLPSTFPGDEDCDTLILHLADPVIGLAADLIYTTFEEEDVITRSVILKNTAGQPIYVTKVADFQLYTTHPFTKSHRNVFKQVLHGRAFHRQHTERILKRQYLIDVFGSDVSFRQGVPDSTDID